MPQSLEPIPVGTPISDAQGRITTFFRLRWQTLIDGFQVSATKAVLNLTGQSAALVTTALQTTASAGPYRVSFGIRKTTIDGVSSSLQVTLGWTQDSVPLTETFAAVTADSVTIGKQNDARCVWADALTDLTIAVAYASNTPGQMKYRVDVTVEQLAP